MTSRSWMPALGRTMLATKAELEAFVAGFHPPGQVWISEGVEAPAGGADARVYVVGTDSLARELRDRLPFHVGVTLVCGPGQLTPAAEALLRLGDWPGVLGLMRGRGARLR